MHELYGKYIDILLIAPLPPPASGIATITESMCAQATKISAISLSILDTAVRWRRQTQHNNIMRVLGGSAQALYVYGKCVQLVNSHRPDLVCLTTSGGPAFLKDWLILHTLRRMSIPSVLSVHMGRLPGLLKTNGFEAVFAKATMRQANITTVLDESSYSAIKRCDSSLNVVKVPNFIDLVDIERAIACFGNNNERDADIVYVGHIIPKKGVLELVRACTSIPGLKLKLVGPGESGFVGLLKREATSNNLCISFTGEIPKSKVYLNILSSRALALPSYTEAFPNVILEAMALGRPVIATPVGAIPEILEFNAPIPCGKRVEVQSVSSISEALLDLTAHPESWIELGRRGRDRVTTNYTGEVVFPYLLDIWRSIA